jgi:hypothetical protein
VVSSRNVWNLAESLWHPSRTVQCRAQLLNMWKHEACSPTMRRTEPSPLQVMSPRFINWWLAVNPLRLDDDIVEAEVRSTHYTQTSQSSMELSVAFQSFLRRIPSDRVNRVSHTNCSIGKYIE